MNFKFSIFYVIGSWIIEEGINKKMIKSKVKNKIKVKPNLIKLLRFSHRMS
jgi:hypothetical protein